MKASLKVIERKNQQMKGANKAVKELDRQVKAIVAVSVNKIGDTNQTVNRPATKAGFVKMNVVSSLSKD